LLITFIFLALTAACKPFCTEGLSRLHALTLVAQFITLYGGLVLIVEDYIKQQLAAANQSDGGSSKLVIIYGLVYLCNGAVVGWPAIQLVLLNSPADIAAEVQSKVKALASGKCCSESDSEEEEVEEEAAREGATNVAGDGRSGGQTSQAYSEASCQVTAMALKAQPLGLAPLADPSASKEMTPPAIPPRTSGEVAAAGVGLSRGGAQTALRTDFSHDLCFVPDPSLQPRSATGSLFEAAPAAGGALPRDVGREPHAAAVSAPEPASLPQADPAPLTEATTQKTADAKSNQTAGGAGAAADRQLGSGSRVKSGQPFAAMDEAGSAVEVSSAAGAVILSSGIILPAASKAGPADPEFPHLLVIRPAAAAPDLDLTVEPEAGPALANN
jgi:hypothetical protein